jgi:hypothetical protein
MRTVRFTISPLVVIVAFVALLGLRASEPVAAEGPGPNANSSVDSGSTQQQGDPWMSSIYADQTYGAVQSGVRLRGSLTSPLLQDDFWTWQESRLTDNPSDQFDPSISGHYCSGQRHVEHLPGS